MKTNSQKIHEARDRLATHRRGATVGFSIARLIEHQRIICNVQLAGPQHTELDWQGTGEGAHLAVVVGTIVTYLNDRRSAAAYARAWRSLAVPALTLPHWDPRIPPENADLHPGIVTTARAYHEAHATKVRGHVALTLGPINWFLMDDLAAHDVIGVWRKVSEMLPAVWPRE